MCNPCSPVPPQCFDICSRSTTISSQVAMPCYKIHRESAEMFNVALVFPTTDEVVGARGFTNRSYGYSIEPRSR